MPRSSKANQPHQEKPRRILIASSHGLFGQGLRSLLLEREQADVEVVGIVSNIGEALEALSFAPERKRSSSLRPAHDGSSPDR